MPVRRRSIRCSSSRSFRFGNGKWDDAIKYLERVLLEFSPGDSRIPQARYFLGEARFAIGSHLEAAREFRRVSDETPNDRLAPEALLRVARRLRRSLAPARAGSLLRPDRSGHLPGAAQPVRQLARRPAGRRQRITRAGGALRIQGVPGGDCSTSSSRPTIRRSSTSRTWSRRIRATSIAPDALVKLVEAYRRLGYQEDVQETCGYLRRFHPNAVAAPVPCPADTAGTS